MITEDDFFVEHIPQTDTRYWEYLEKYYFVYGSNPANRNYKAYAKEKMMYDFKIKRYNLGMVNIWFRNQLARTVLLTNYRNWCLMSRSITYTEVIDAHLTYLAVPSIEKVIIDNKLDGLLMAFNERKFHNLCFTAKIRQTRKPSESEPFLLYLFEKNYELMQMGVAPKQLFLFNSVPQYIAYYPVGDKTPDFLVPYEKQTTQ